MCVCSVLFDALTQLAESDGANKCICYGHVSTKRVYWCVVWGQRPRRSEINSRIHTHVHTHSLTLRHEIVPHYVTRHIRLRWMRRLDPQTHTHPFFPHLSDRHRNRDRPGMHSPLATGVGFAEPFSFGAGALAAPDLPFLAFFLSCAMLEPVTVLLMLCKTKKLRRRARARENCKRETAGQKITIR